MPVVPAPALPAPEEPAHYPEIDRLKAIAIVAVVVIHSLRPFAHPQLSPLERALAVVTQFAVPCFLMCSGFLYAGPGIAQGAALRRRLSRLLPAYSIAAVLAGLFREGVLGQPVAWVRDLLLGHTFGAYYYVFVIATLVLVTPLVARLPVALRVPLSLFLILSGSLRSLAPLLSLAPETTGRLNAGLDPTFPWHLRHPLLQWGYFFLGWELRGAAGLLTQHVWRRGGPRRLLALLVALSWGAVVVWAWGADTRALVLISWPLIYLTLIALYAWSFERTRLSWLERFLSRHTYFIYLYHLFFVFTAQRLWPQPTHGVSFAALATYATLGLLGPSLLCAVLERVLPPRAGRVLGLPTMGGADAGATRRARSVPS